MPRKNGNAKKRKSTSSPRKIKFKKSKTCPNKTQFELNHPPRFDISINKFKQMSDPSFSSFEQDPENATILSYLNSGLMRFHDLENLPSIGPKIALQKEIQNEPPTQHELHQIITRFFEARFMYPHKHHHKESFKVGKILACGLCGISLPEQNIGHIKRFHCQIWLI